MLVSAVIVTSVSCATTGSVVTQRKEAGYRDMVIREMEYDAYGLPVISEQLENPPSNVGERFTRVKLAEDRPLVSYDIVILEQKPEFVKPLDVIYEWTGRGFRWGVRTAEATLKYAADQHDLRGLIVAVTISPVPIAAGLAGGYMVGIGNGILQGVKETSKFIVSEQEFIVTLTTYEYDDLGRLAVMRMFNPDNYEEFVRTVYTYAGDSRVPSRSQIIDMGSGTVKAWE